ncbi:phosphopyruvate hydratase [Streptomyces sp. NPDC050619]|uniref:phosphopyruvate hydratase n=1 Tax=Streptomyces sp. NPDC050619 TaxID=3157214 RepID=UPI00343CF4B6
MTKIETVRGRHILDSRGNPTVEVDVHLADGSFGRAAVPSGASTGEREAVELRDGDPTRWHARGVGKAVHNVNTVIAESLLGLDAQDQQRVDETMIELDGTAQKSKLGANGMLGVSLAVLKAAAAAHGLPLYRYVGGVDATLLPTPMMNIVNGGAHADNPLDFQEFMIMPVGAPTFGEAVRMGMEIFHTLKRALAAAGEPTNVGDEGGFAPNFATAEQALDFVLKAVSDSGYTPGTDVAIALDPAASEFYVDGAYRYGGGNTVRSTDQQIDYFESLLDNYPIISIEDPIAENDRRGWESITERLGSRCQIVGDDVFCTNPALLADGIDHSMANSILVKLNQIGTVTEFLRAVRLAQQSSYGVVVSHRSGETEDTTISDLVVGVRAGQLKTGSLSRSDRTAKYNQLLRIEEELGASAQFAGARLITSHPGTAG